MTLKLLLCGEAPDGAWDALRIAQALERAVPELKQPIEVSLVRAKGAGEAVKAAGASHFDLALAAIPFADGALQPNLRSLASFAIAATKSDASFKDAIAFGATDIVVAGPGFESRLESALIAAARRLVVSQCASELGLKRDIPFIAMLAHELKSPIAAVDTYLRMMDAKESGDSIASYDRMIKRSLLRIEAMHKLIGDIMDLARAESYGSKRKIEAVNVLKTCQDAMEPLTETAGRRGVTINCAVAESCAFESAHGDLRAIISNLLSNAVKYNRNGGSVTLSAAKNSDILKITVTDTGIGMEPEELSKLTGDFARIRNSDTRDIPGSGLGLSIVRRIASLYGGTLSIKSKRGAGSSFAVELRDGPSDRNQQF